MRVKIPYLPRFPQTVIHPQLESHRFCVLVSHRQMGKTVCTVNNLLKRALLTKRKEARYFYVAPFLKQAKLIAWDYLKKYTAPLPVRTVNENELSVKLPNGAKIWVMGADNPDALRGTYADGVVLDEYAQIKPDVYDEIISAMLTSRGGWVVFCGTPKGQNHFYDLYRFASKKAQEPGSDWWVGMFRADQTGVISDKELGQIKEKTPEHIFRQEYLCDFTASCEDVFIPIDLAVAAQERKYGDLDVRHAPMVLGADPARFGGDRAVIMARRGLQVYPPMVYAKLDNMQFVSHITEAIQTYNPDAVFIDAGEGGGVIDRLRQLGFDCVEVAFGGAANQPGRFVNRRTEMYAKCREWLKLGGALPGNTELAAELAQPRYSYDAANRMKLEAKADIKKRLGKSPDLADALVLTFAEPVQKRAAYAAGRGGKEFAKTEYEFWD